MRSQSSADDQGRNGNQPASTIEHTNLSARIKYSSNIQDVGGTVGGQLAAVIAIGLHIGFNLSQIESNTDSILLKDQEIGIGASLVLSVAASFIWCTKHRHDNHTSNHDKFVAIRSYLNPWYRRFKTAMAIGNSIGTSGIELAYIFLPLPAWLKKPAKLIAGNIVGMIVGIIGATFFPDNPDKDGKSVFRLGRDGWSKYAKAGLLPGNLIGAAIGAIIGFLLPIPGGMAAGIALGTIFGGLIGFVGCSLIVPLINKIAGKNVAGDKFRSQYVRTGTSFGMYIGTLIGFTVGFFLPFPGATLLCSTVGAAIGGAIGAVILAIVGPIINNASSGEKDQNYSSPDYGARTGMMFGNQFGLGSVVSGLFSYFKIGTAYSNLKDVIFSVGAIITGLVGGIYDYFQGKKTKRLSPQEYENGKPILSWSDRVRSFVTLGGFLGGIIGFVVGTVIGGPIGGTIGVAIGTGAAGVIAGGIGALWGDTIYKKFALFAEKIGFVFADTKVDNKLPEPVNIPPVSPTYTKIKNEIMTEEESESDKENIQPSPLREDGYITPSKSDDELNSPATPKLIPKRDASLSGSAHSLFGSHDKSTLAKPLDDSTNHVSYSPRLSEGSEEI